MLLLDMLEELEGSGWGRIEGLRLFSLGEL